MVFPIRVDARALPFAADFFDAVVSIDSFVYYGTDDLYANDLAGFVRPGGQIGIAGAGLVQEIERAGAGAPWTVVGAEHGVPALRRNGGPGIGSAVACSTSSWPT